MRISPEVEIALTLAQNEAARRRHEYFTLEHLLYALLFDESTAVVVRHAGGDPAAIKKELEQFLSDQLESVPEETFDVPAASLAVQRAIRRAAAHVQSSGKEQITGANVLVAIFAERESPAVSILEKAGVTRLDVVAYISHGVSKADEPEEREKEAASLDCTAKARARGAIRSRRTRSTSTTRRAKSESIRSSEGRTRSRA
jgi:ATP-dependent Clp protease ATP-binding subunit ClpA